MNPNLWNEDGTPKRPDTNPYDTSALYAQTPFANLVVPEADEDGMITIPRHEGEDDARTYVNYARLRAQAKVNTPAGIGDIVHYWHDDACYAAIVTRDAALDDSPDGLFVFSDLANMSGTVKARHSESKRRDTWHWPESL